MFSARLIDGNSQGRTSAGSAYAGQRSVGPAFYATASAGPGMEGGRDASCCQDGASRGRTSGQPCPVTPRGPQSARRPTRAATKACTDPPFRLTAPAQRLEFRGRRIRQASFHSVLAQLVEQLTVNQRVAGSSPADGANKIRELRPRSRLLPAAEAEDRPSWCQAGANLGR